MRDGVFIEKPVSTLSVAAWMCLIFAVGAGAAPYAEVTFRAEAYGTLSAAVDGVPIASGDSANVGKSVLFTAVPYKGYGNIRWSVNGSEIADPSLGYTLMVGISNSAPVDVAVSFELLPPPTAAIVTFRAAGHGAVTAAVDGVPIASGDSVKIGKEVVFTALPDYRKTAVCWTVNGEETVDTSFTYTLAVEILTADSVAAAVSFEIYVKPPLEALSGLLTFGPNPVRSGGEAAVFWSGSKTIGGELFVFNALGNKIATVNVGGVGKIGAWNTVGVARGTYMMKGMLKDKDGFKCRALILVDVVR